MVIKDKEIINFNILDTKYKLNLKPNHSIYPSVILNQTNLILGDKNSEFIILIENLDLETSKFWDFIFEFYKKNYIILAKWYYQYLLFSHLEGLFTALGWSFNYKTKSEWEEWSRLKQSSELLLNLYDFPINTMRLWDRFTYEIQQIWLEILSIFRIKKNLLREIIHDLYDLSIEDQKFVSIKSLELAKNFQNKKNNLFPQEEIRDLVKSKRFPLSYHRKKESYKLKKKLEHHLQLKNLDIHLPEDLESQPIEFKLLLRNKEDLEIFIDKIQNPKNKELIIDLLEYVFEK
ncbi:MAG: hypothetical protein KatS3mg129_0841 [Leptospiraceae bacterium]|nr:MAG: hypothetical protein KatS3mg129_0841 [Leptospiraceae bacterium]